MNIPILINGYPAEFTGPKYVRRKSHGILDLEGSAVTVEPQPTFPSLSALGTVAAPEGKCGVSGCDMLPGWDTHRFCDRHWDMIPRGMKRELKRHRTATSAKRRQIYRGTWHQAAKYAGYSDKMLKTKEKR